jgi:hypothetical protein
LFVFAGSRRKKGSENFLKTSVFLPSPIRFGSERGIKMVTVRESNRFRSKITGNAYEVKKIVNEMIILESLNGKSQVLTELNHLALLYEKELARVEDQG